MTDPALLSELASVFDQMDPVPVTVLAAAEVARRARPARPVRLLAQLRGTPAVRGAGLLTFAGPDDTVALEVAAAGRDTVRVIGVAPSADRLVVRWPTGERWLPVDELGRFAGAGVPRGPLCLVVHRRDRVALTPWFLG
ncbi:MAG TPA: hypothetical protein VHW44_32445 [Pseudonocardiaceae bacterium]|jgi:hypothetical protein|nr:hypothetical protein [Pseudonocardiaceae bacterium]